MNPTLLAALLLPGCSVFLDFPGKDAAEPAEPPDSGDTAAPDTADDTGAPHTGETDTGAPPDTDTGEVPDTGDPVVDTEAPYELDTAWVDTGGEPVSELCVGGVAAFVVATGETFPTVDDALDAAADGDTVQVCPGRWTTNTRLSDSVTLAGYGPRRTFLDGGLAGRVLYVDEDLAVTLRDLAVIRGVSTVEGGCVKVASSGQLTLDRALLAACTAGTYGGALMMESPATLTVTGSTFQDSLAEDLGDGGAVYLQASAYATFTDTTFVGNRAHEGGAVYLGESGAGTTTFVRATFRENGATRSGGALAAGGRCSPDIVLEDSVFEGNRALQHGGAILLDGWNSPSIEATGGSFVGNDAYYGGAVVIGTWEVASARFTGTTFEANTAFIGGAIGLNGQGEESLELVGGAVIANVATAEDGGLATDNDGTVTITGTDFGEGATDNLPWDVEGGVAFGSGASFSCNGQTCR